MIETCSSCREALAQVREYRSTKAPSLLWVSDDGSDISHDDVEAEFESIRRKAGIKSFASSWVKRSYSFGDPEIPTGESEWLKVVYGFDRTQHLSSSSIR